MSIWHIKNNHFKLRFSYNFAFILSFNTIEYYNLLDLFLIAFYLFTGEVFLSGLDDLQLSEFKLERFFILNIGYFLFFFR